jgi:hypothetical protein
MKFCSSCSTEKENSEFNINKSRKDGLQTYCKICSRKRQAEDYKTNPNRKKSVQKSRNNNYKYNRRFVNRYKAICGCAFCKEKTPICLDFHHVDPSGKDLEVSVLVGMAFSRLKNEIRKCVVLCSNCHRKLHANLISLRV